MVCSIGEILVAQLSLDFNSRGFAEPGLRSRIPPFLLSLSGRVCGSAAILQTSFCTASVETA